MKKMIIALSIMQVFTQSVLGMKKKRRELPKWHKVLRYPSITIYGGQTPNEKKEYQPIELINLKENDAIRHDSFVHIIKEESLVYDLKNIEAYLLAAVLVEVEPNKYARHYVDALMLNKWVFGNEAGGVTKVHDKYFHTQQPIIKIDYFAISTLKDKFVFICSDSDLQRKDIRGKILRLFVEALIKGYFEIRNHGFKGEIAAYTQSQAWKNEPAIVQNTLNLILGFSFTSKSKDYFEKAFKNGSGLAAYELGIRSLHVNHFDKAKYYFGQLVTHGYPIVGNYYLGVTSYLNKDYENAEKYFLQTIKQETQELIKLRNNVEGAGQRLLMSSFLAKDYLIRMFNEKKSKNIKELDILNYMSQMLNDKVRMEVLKESFPKKAQQYLKAQ